MFPTRLVLFLGLTLFLHGRGAADTASPASLPSLLIDQVWAGHPVSFALLTERGYQFVAYYDAERRLTVAGRKLDSSEWTRIRVSGTPVPERKRDSNVTGWDSHNYLRLALDREGGLHLSGNMHVDPLVYYRTRVPFDVSTLERIDRMTGEHEERCTYPVFFKNAAGDLFFRYRDGTSGNGSDLYNRYDLATYTWQRALATPVLEGEGQRNAYALDPVLGPDGRFHLVWMWRESPDCSTNNHLSYARSRDFVHWETSRGQALTLPITLSTGDVIDSATPGEGLINMTFNLGFTAQQKPVVVYHRYDAAHHSQAYIAQPNEKKNWNIHLLSHWDFCWAFSGPGSITAEVTLGAPRAIGDNLLLVDYATQTAGSGRWQVRADTLETAAQLPAAPPVLPEPLLRPQSETPGMEVQTVVSRADGRRYVLRWETLPRNRDKPRNAAPPPTELRLYETADTEMDGAVRVGS